MLISVVIPCYRSTQTIGSVVDEITQVFNNQSQHDYQIVLVNDGSPDHTFEVISALCEQNQKIVGVNLSRNFGQAVARMAALPFIKGDVAVYMDDDGQHPAHGIIPLAEKVQEGYDIVYARFAHKKHSLFKRITSRLHGKIQEWIGNKPKGIYSSAFFAWSRFAVDSLKNYHSPFPSSSSYLAKVTTRFANVDVEHRERIAGESGYNFRKLFALWLMNFTNFSLVPLRIADVLGVFAAALGFLFGIVVVIRKIINPEIAMGYSSVMATLLIIGGIIMLLLGLMGEYIGRIYMVISDTPQYSIRETRNSEDVASQVK